MWLATLIWCFTSGLLFVYGISRKILRRCFLRTTFIVQTQLYNSTARVACREVVKPSLLAWFLVLPIHPAVILCLFSSQWSHSFPSMWSRHEHCPVITSHWKLLEPSGSQLQSGKERINNYLLAFFFSLYYYVCIALYIVFDCKNFLVNL